MGRGKQLVAFLDYGEEKLTSKARHVSLHQALGERRLPFSPLFKFGELG